MDALNFVCFETALMLLSNYLFRSDVTIAFHVFLILAKRNSGGVKAALFFTAKAKPALFERFTFLFLITFYV